MGLLWLSTVPLTNGVVAGIFGVKHLSMLSGFVNFSHQVGSFFGVWLGGYLYTNQGNYNAVWMITIALGVFAALINLPISEKAIVRAAPAMACPRQNECEAKAMAALRDDRRRAGGRVHGLSASGLH